MTKPNNQDVSKMSTEELLEMRKKLEQDIEQANEQQHELLKEANSIGKTLSGLELPEMTTKKAKDAPSTEQQPKKPVTGVTPQNQQENKIGTMSIMGAAAANYLNNRKARQKSPSPTSIEDNNKSVMDLGSKLIKGRVVKNLCDSTLEHMKVLENPASSKAEIMGAMKGVKDNMSNIQQSMTAQLKGLQYLDKKGFDKAVKGIKSDAADISKLGDAMAKSASVLNLRSEVVPEELQQNFHQLGETAKNVAKTVGDTVKNLMSQLAPKSSGLSVGA